jgi:hypothetical protein
MARERFSSSEIDLPNGKKAEIIAYTDNVVRARIKKGGGLFTLGEAYLSGEGDSIVAFFPREKPEPKVSPESSGIKYDYFKFDTRAEALELVAAKSATGVSAGVFDGTWSDGRVHAWAVKRA